MCDTCVINMRKLVFFSCNFSNDFIEKCWKSDPGLAKHFRSKLNIIVEKENLSYVSINAFFSFFFELSSSNQEILCNWIIENYNGIS